MDNDLTCPDCGTDVPAPAGAHFHGLGDPAAGGGNVAYKPTQQTTECPNVACGRKLLRFPNSLVDSRWHPLRTARSPSDPL